MNDYSSHIKNGAELLLKGASLLKEPCEICNGVLLDYKNTIICVNCKKEIEKSKPSIKLETGNRMENGENSDKDEILDKKTFQYCIDHLQIKIISSIERLKIDEDYYIQKNKLDLIESYIRILKELTTF